MVFGVQAGVAVLKSPAMGEEEVRIVGVVDLILGSEGVIGREQLLQTCVFDHGAMVEGCQDFILRYLL